MKKKILVVASIMIMVGLTACGGVTGKVSQKLDTIEVGTSFDTATYFECKKGTIIKLKSGSDINTNQIGEVSADFIISKGDKIEEKSYTFKVVDTKAPIIEGNNITIYSGADFVPENYVSCTDNSGETVSVTVKSSNVDTAMAGIYTVVYEATDSSKNTSEKTISVEVISIETAEDVMDLVDEFLTKNEYSEFKYNKNKFDAVFITGPKLSGLTLNSERTLTVYPEIYILEDVFNSKYGVSSIIFRMEFKDSGEYTSRYVLSADKMTVLSGSDSISIVFDGIPSIGEFETSYYLSRFDYRVDKEDLNKFMSMIENESMTFKIEPQHQESDYSTFPIKTTYTTIPMVYKLSNSDIETLRKTVDICRYMLEVLGEY